MYTKKGLLFFTIFVFMQTVAFAQKTKIMLSEVLTSEPFGKEYVYLINKKYNELNPGVVVGEEPVPYAQGREQAILKHMGGNVPSATFCTVQWIAELAEAGVLASVEKYYTAEELAQYPKKFIDDVSYKGQMYAVPYINGPIVLQANKNLLKKAGWNPPRGPKDMDEFRLMIKKISELGKDEKGNKIKGFALRTAQNKNSAFWFVPWVLNYNGSLIDKNNRPTLNTRAFKDALEFYQWLGVNEYAPLGQTAMDTRNLFANGNFGFLLDGPWIRGILRNIKGQGRKKGGIDDTYMTVTMPNSATGEPFSIANHHALCMFEKAKNKDEIMKYLKWRTTDKWANKNMFEITGMMPGSQKILSDPFYKNDPYLKAFIANAPFVDGTPWKDPNWTTMQDVISVAFQEALLGKNINKITKKAQEEMENMMQ